MQSVPSAGRVFFLTTYAHRAFYKIQCHLTGQSQGSASTHLARRRRLAEVQSEHQSGEERALKWLWTWWTWSGCWSGRLSVSQSADLLGFPHATTSASQGSVMFIEGAAALLAAPSSAERVNTQQSSFNWTKRSLSTWAALKPTQGWDNS